MSSRSRARGEDLVGEDGGPSEAGRLDRQPRLRVDLPHRVKAVRRVLLGRLVAAALVRQHVHDDGRAERLGVGERGLHLSEVVAVDGAEVLEAQVLEHALAGR